MAYFDNNATTPLDPRVAAAMRPWTEERHGNPSSSHAAGRAARQAVETAREHVATLLGARAPDIVFMASGSEANATAIASIAHEHVHRGHLLVSMLEHPSVHASAARAAEGGMELTEIAPGADGRVAPSRVARELREDTRLVCLMAANNELGTIQPVAEAAAVCRPHGAVLLCDAAQAAGKIPLDVGLLGADFVVIGGHKFHGPSGSAALWVRPERGPERALRALVPGAPQESGRRAGTENVPACVGLGEASRLASEELAQRARDLAALRERFESGLAAILPDAKIHCRAAPRVPHVSHVAFPGVLGLSLAARLDAAGFAVSIGAACSSGTPTPSRVVVATGVEPAEALASLRISFGIFNTAEEVDRFLELLPHCVKAEREQRAPSV